MVYDGGNFEPTCSEADLNGLDPKGEMSSKEAVSAAIDRMHAVNPKLNAVVNDLSASALTTADQLDQAMVQEQEQEQGALEANQQEG